jgi:Transcriptional regulators
LPISCALDRQRRIRRGLRLPTERDIAEQLKVSRPTVREALIALEVEGASAFASVPESMWPSRPCCFAVAGIRDHRGPFELLRAREFIEGAIAEQAARVAKPKISRASTLRLRRWPTPSIPATPR